MECELSFIYFLLEVPEPVDAEQTGDTVEEERGAKDTDVAT